MNTGDTETIVTRLVKLYPRAEWTTEQIETWKEYLRKFEYSDANSALTAHFNASKFIPKPSDIAWRINEYSHQRRLDTPSEEKMTETFVQQLRRMHEIPTEASDGDVLVWWHICEVEKARKVYASGFESRVPELRKAFRRDWKATGRPNGQRAECRVFGNSEDCETFWATK